MDEDTIKNLLGYGYWVCVDIDDNIFIAKIYRLNKRSNIGKKLKCIPLKLLKKHGLGPDQH